MKVKELIEQLQKVDGESKVFMAYDGNIVVTEPRAVKQMRYPRQIGAYWHRVEVGDTVILCDR
jgi:hypothetical protein